MCVVIVYAATHVLLLLHVMLCVLFSCVLLLLHVMLGALFSYVLLLLHLIMLRVLMPPCALLFAVSCYCCTRCADVTTHEATTPA